VIQIGYYFLATTKSEKKGTGVTAYMAPDAVTRHIEGTAKVNGVAGFTYQVDVSDKGKSGRNDTFAIRLFNASGASIYSASGTLKDDDIQVRRSCDKGDKGGNGDHGEHGGYNH
jgi:hypothetical protein